MKRLTLSMVAIALAAAPLLARSSAGAVTGTYVEARTAEVFAGGCVMNSEAGTAGRQAVLAWKIENGSFKSVSLAGLSIVAAVSADQNLGLPEIGGDRPDAKAVVFVDRRATAAQRTALVAMANSMSHGLLDTVVQVIPAPIQFTENGHTVQVAADNVVALEVSKHLDHSAGCGDMQWFHPLSSVKNPVMGMTERNTFTGTGLGTRWSDPNKRSSFVGTF
jgi:hypothetical protein